MKAQVLCRTATIVSISLSLLGALLTSTVQAQSYVLQSTFGTFGSANGQFEKPLFLAIDSTTRNIVVGDQTANRVQIFDPTGVLPSTFGSFGSGNGQFSVPDGVAIDPTTHNIVVTDFDNLRVQIFDSSGNYLSQFRNVSAPNGVAIDPTTHNIVVADDARVDIFDSTGIFVSAFGSLGNGNGELRAPIGVAIDPTAHNIVVSDLLNNNVQIFNSTGVYLSRLNGQFSGPNFVAIDPTTHNIFVSDGFNHRVQIFASTGAYLSQFGLSGEPWGVAIDPTTHNVVVADLTLTRVEIYAPSAAPTALDLNQHGLTGSWYEPATDGQGIEVEVYPDLSPEMGSTFVSWFTYDAVSGGADHQRWYTAQGPVATGQPNAALTIYQNTGGNFNAPPITSAQPVGTASLSFDTCTSGQLSYIFTDGTGRTGNIPLTRITQNVTCSATAPYPTNSDFALSGNWYEAATSGQGFTVEVNPVSGAFFATWYTYVPIGTTAGVAGQRWYTAQGAFTPGMRSIPVTIYETTGGMFDQPTPPGQNTVSVGTATMAFQSCSAATFAYNFTGGTSMGLSGTITLSRVGPMPPGCTS